MNTTKKYHFALLQAPEKNSVTGTQQIELVLMDSPFAAETIDALTQAGFLHVGFAESDLSRGELMRGLNTDAQARYQQVLARLQRIAKLVDELTSNPE